MLTSCLYKWRVQFGPVDLSALKSEQINERREQSDLSALTKVKQTQFQSDHSLQSLLIRISPVCSASMKLYAIVSAAIVVLISAVSLPLLNNLYWGNLKALIPQVRLVADLIVRNGTIFTSEDDMPFADSMAIRNGRILRVGNYYSIQDLAGDRTAEVNLEGKIVVPGFIDSHVHLIPGGLQRMRVALRGVNQKDEFVRRVKEAAQNAKEGSWILGGGWNNDIWGGELPSAAWIDDISQYNPIWLTRMDGHMGLANSVALKIAGITSFSEDLIGGTIMRTSKGEPSGLLIDAAMKLILPSIPEVSVDERREALLKASKYALSRGVTTVVDMGNYFPGLSPEKAWKDLSDVYQWADSSMKMTIRVCLFYPMETWSRLSDLINQRGRKLSDWLFLGGVKSFSDGSLGSNSALFHKAYLDEPGNHGLQVTDLETLTNLTMDSDKAGLQIAIHAIGDKANDMVLDLYEAVATTNRNRERRFRIEHAQHLTVGSAARFGQQGLVASVQPDHLLDDGDSAIKKLGKDRAEEGSYLFRSLLSSNALLALGSDWPVADINPLQSIRTAMKRTPPGWSHAWSPSECLSLKDALIAHTISAAKAAFLEKELGSLSAGKFADFDVLSNASWEDFAQDGSASVHATYVAGKQAYP